MDYKRIFTYLINCNDLEIDIIEYPHVIFI